MTSDSGRLPEGENSRSEVECEASQSGGAAASPEHRSSPSIDEELIERLIAKEDRGHFKSAELRADGLHIIEKVLVLRNPDGPEAADRLESLLSDRAKLEEALRQIRDWRVNGAPDKWVATRGEMRILAGAALNKSTDCE